MVTCTDCGDDIGLLGEVRVGMLEMGRAGDDFRQEIRRAHHLNIKRALDFDRSGQDTSIVPDEPDATCPDGEH